MVSCAVLRRARPFCAFHSMLVLSLSQVLYRSCQCIKPFHNIVLSVSDELYLTLYN